MVPFSHPPITLKITLVDDQARTKISVGVNAMETRGNSLESARKGAPERGINPSPTPHSFQQNIRIRPCGAFWVFHLSILGC